MNSFFDNRIGCDFDAVWLTRPRQLLFGMQSNQRSDWVGKALVEIDILETSPAGHPRIDAALAVGEVSA